MTRDWKITMKSTFLVELRALQDRDTKAVMEKIEILERDPVPDGQTKKRLHNYDGPVCRLRCGDHRIFYTFEHPYISLLSVRNRKDAYDDDVDAEFLGGFDPKVETKAAKPQPDWERLLAPKEAPKRPLPEPITADLLGRLRVPDVYHERLIRVTTQEDLFACPGVPEDHLLALDDVLFGNGLADLLEEPDYIASGVDDLLRYKEGSLLGFLLRLDPEQEKYVEWALEAQGPTLLKGGPGTGKSTIAIYRVKALLDRLPSSPRPRILFTTYTNALVAFTRQLLQQLLGERALCVDVRTADSVVTEILRTSGHTTELASARVLDAVLREAIDTAEFVGNELQRAAQRQTIARLGGGYVLEEIETIIGGRGLPTLDAYLAAARPGRLVALNATQRRAVWAVRERFRSLLGERSLTTFSQQRCAAAAIVETGQGPSPWDAVVVDEAQDLSPVVLGMLFRLAAQPNRVFVTADANQSIYGSGFRWTDVHERLRFQGRTGVLKANHRSTREIGEAAQSYLLGRELDDVEVDRRYSHTGPLPALRVVADGDAEAELLARFFPGAAREFRLGIGSCAVLVPGERAGRALADRLLARKIPAQWMTGRDLDLDKPVVKVITQKSAKGLEFPIVAIAGFAASRKSADAAADPALDPNVHAEALAVDRRTMFVAMTRAMRALLVLRAQGREDDLFAGIDARFWNLEERPTK